MGRGCPTPSRFLGHALSPHRRHRKGSHCGRGREELDSWEIGGIDVMNMFLGSVDISL